MNDFARSFNSLFHWFKTGAHFLFVLKTYHITLQGHQKNLTFFQNFEIFHRGKKFQKLDFLTLNNHTFPSPNLQKTLCQLDLLINIKIRNNHFQQNIADFSKHLKRKKKFSWLSILTSLSEFYDTAANVRLF